jgi:hypothetical protein
MTNAEFESLKRRIAKLELGMQEAVSDKLMGEVLTAILRKIRDNLSAIVDVFDVTKPDKYK